MLSARASPLLTGGEEASVGAGQTFFAEYTE
jgi:hypothetical protein